MIPNIGPMEIAVVLIIALMIFGPKKLPDLGRNMGRGIREFGNSITGKDEAKPGMPEPEATVDADVVRESHP